MSEKHTDHTALYLKVFSALMVLTVLTVGASRIHFPGHLGMIVGVLIACLKAGLVASVFMHLKWEKPLIYGVLGLTLFFAVFLFGLPIIDFAWIDSHTPTDVAAQGPHRAPASDSSGHH